MDNEILRVSNKERINDTEIASSSYGGVSEKNSTAKKENSFYSLLTGELSDRQNLSNANKVAVDKPKLFEPIALAVLLLASILIISLVCYITKELSLVPLLILLSGVSVPTALTYFCFRLNTHNDVNLMSILKLALTGAVVSAIINYIFNSVSNTFFGASIVATLVRCIVEILAVVFIIIFAVNNNKSNNYMSVLLISCSVAAGFICVQTVTELFYSLFIRMDVSDGNLTQSLGAIINSDNYINLSVKSLVYSVVNLSLFKPSIFILLSIINGFAFRFVSVKNSNGTVSGITGGLLYPLTLVVYLLTEFVSSISFMQAIYNTMALMLTVYTFYMVVNYCIKNENYNWF